VRSVRRRVLAGFFPVLLFASAMLAPAGASAITTTQLSATELAAGSSNIPVFGESVDLETTLTDAASGAPIPEIPLTLQSSDDGIVWTDMPVKVIALPAGRYRARVTASPTLPWLFRFVLPGNAWFEPAEADPIDVFSHDGATTFDDPFPVELSPLGAELPFGGVAGADISLWWAIGEPCVGQKLVLMCSSDGVNYVPSVMPVVDLGYGDYQARFLATAPLWYKFVLPARGLMPRSESKAFRVERCGGFACVWRYQRKTRRNAYAARTYLCRERQFPLGHPRNGPRGSSVFV
jgi:hypothetical protein